MDEEKQTAQTTRYILVRGHVTTDKDGNKAQKMVREPRVVAVNSGIRPFDLAILLSSAFPDDSSGEPVGLEDDFGNVIALSVACRNPETLAAPSYKVLRLAQASPTTEQQVLLDAVADLTDIPESQRSLLRSLAFSDHDLVMGALGRFNESKNRELLLQSLKSVGRFVAKRLEIASESFAHLQKPNIVPTPTTNHSMTKSEMSIILGVIRELVRDRKITLAGGTALKRLVLDGAECMKAAYEVYVYNQDKEDLKETLCHIVQIFMEDTQLQVAHEAAATVTEEGGPFPMEEVTVLLSSVDADPVDKLVLQLLTEKSHAVMHAAYLAYLPKSDHQDLLDTLQRIVRRYSIDLVLVKMLETDLITKQNAHYLRSVFIKRDPLVLGAWDAFVDSGAGQAAADEFMDSLRRILWKASEKSHEQSARGAAVIVRTIQRLQGSGLISLKEARLLEALARSHDTQLIGALQDFSQHQDAEYLVDTLRTTCVANFTAKKELLDLVIALKNDDRLTPHQYIVLRHLILNGEETVYAAHAVYLESQDVNDLIDTLMKIVNIQLAKLKQLQEARASAGENPAHLGKGRLWQFMLSLVQAGKLRTNEFAVLAALAHKSDGRIVTAFERYGSGQGVDELVQELKDLAESEGAHESPENGEYGEDEPPEQLSQKLAKVISGLNMNAQQVETLQMAVAKGDPVVMAAVQLYESNNDEKELRETLRILAETGSDRWKRRSMNQTAGEGLRELKVLLIDVLTRMDEEGTLLDKADAEKLLRLFSEGDSVVVSAIEVFASDDDYDQVSQSLSRVLAQEDFDCYN